MRPLLLLLGLIGCQADTVDGPPVSDDPTCTVGVREGDCAPDFELPTADGGTDSLSAHAGRRVILVGSAFW